MNSIDSGSIRNGTDNAYNKPIVNEWEYYSLIESLLPTAHIVKEYIKKY